MTWEDLKVYKPLKKEELKPAFRGLTKIIGQNLKEYGFTKRGRKFYRLTYDLVEVIDFDYRGSWTGQSEYFDINIGLIPLCWPDLNKEYYLVASREIKEIDKTIKNHYRISAEYELLADYLTKRIKNKVLPYFEKYNSTKKVVENYRDFKYKSSCGGGDIRKSNYLILCSELKQHQLKRAISIIENEIKFQEHHLRETDNKDSIKLINNGLLKWNNLLDLAKRKDWAAIDGLLIETESLEMKKLKLKPVANNGYSK